MANLRLVLLPAKVLVDGRHKIRIALSHHSDTRYINTRFIVDSLDEFKDGQVINRDDAPYTNMVLREMLNRYQRVIDSLPDIEAYSCSILKQILLRSRNNAGATFKNVTDMYLKFLNDNKKDKSEKLYRLASETFIQANGNMVLSTITPKDIKNFESYLRNKPKKISETTINIYLTLTKVIINFAIKNKMVQYEIHPFEFTRMPAVNSREVDLTVKELKAIRDVELDKYNLRVVRDIFMLSYYLAGINLVDLLKIDFKKKTVLEYVRTKTKDKKIGENKVSFTIQPEAKVIIDKYITKNGKLVFGKYDTFGKCYSVVSRKIFELAEVAGINKRVIFYSARKSFVQHGFELGISLEILEYCIGQSMKTNRPVFNYVRIMRKHADKAMRQIFDNLK